MVSELDLKRAVVEQFGRSRTADLVHLIEPEPREEDHGSAVFKIEPGLHGAKSDLAMAIRSNGHHRGLNQIEVVAIPQVGLNDPPLAYELTACRGGHGDT